GGAVTAGTATADTTASPALTATLTTPSRAVYPARTSVTVRVVSGSAAVPGATVRVFARPAGEPWTLQYTGTTTSSGVVSAALWIGSTTGYYAVADKSGYAEDVSNSTGVEFFPAVNITAMARAVSRRHSISFSGNE